MTAKLSCNFSALSQKFALFWGQKRPNFLVKAAKHWLFRAFDEVRLLGEK